MSRTRTHVSRRTPASLHQGAALAGRALAGLALAAIAALAAACSDSADPSGSHTDQTPPTVSVAAGTASADTTLGFTVDAHDNLGLLQVHAQVSGPGFSGSFDTTFTSTVTQVTIPYEIGVPTSVPMGTQVMVVAYAVDGAHNSSAPDTAYLVTGNAGPTLAVVTSPTSGDSAVVGFSIGVSLSGKTPNKVRALGYIASGVWASERRDSVVYTSPLKDSIAVDTTLSLDGASTGTLTITPFVRDSNKVLALGAPVTVTVISAASANTVPVVDFGLTKRIEVTDTIHVEARDLAGIRWLGYEVRNLASDPNTFFAADSFQVAGNKTPALHTFAMKLNISDLPKDVEVRGFARNTNGTRAYALLDDGSTRGDTVTVVAGVTQGLPFGGAIADALYHPPTDRLYLTNIDRNEIEVFDLADSTFKTPIITGSRPWGITAWPVDRSGTMGDTLLVANSGGTSIDYIDASAGAEIMRYALPNIVAYSVTTKLSETTGQPIQVRTVYDFSDRPQYVAATCTGSTAPGSPCGDVILVYSTTPTPGQTKPFPNQGTVRWENLTRRTSHLFFEHAMGQSDGRSDTLAVDRFAAQGFGVDSALVPASQQAVDGSGNTITYSVVFRIPDLAFRDTTFARNSGNFRRVVIGEGGPVLGSRALMYDVTAGFAQNFPGTATPLPTPVVDLGISRPTAVTDFIANTFARVGGVAINFDGELAAIRGDSTYIVDRDLRLQGLLQTSSANPGFDFHPANAGIGPATSPAGSRVGFAASDKPEIQVYDTYTYRNCMSIPTRDPIIGPIKAATRAGSTDVVLVGATARGVVLVTITAAQLATCQ
ncbi:MAG TPA: hypothetical protein VF041_09225 [Gemmatimonadaceae bacterium]